MNQGLVEIVTFDIINTQLWLDPWFVNWNAEEGSPLSYNFEGCGFETTWFLLNSSATVWIYCLHIVMFLAYLLVAAIFRRFGRLQALQKKLSTYLFFNGVIRLFAETFLDLYVSSLLNIVAADWETTSALIRASNVVSVGVFVLCNVLVVLLAFVYLRNYHKIDDKSSYRVLLEGTELRRPDRKSKWNLLLPAF